MSQPEQEKEFSAYAYGEARTAVGQVVEFTSAPEDRGKIAEALSHARTIFSATDHKVNIEHGGYGRYSRYEIRQHEYSGGNGEEGGYAFSEVLEVKDPPNGRHGIVLYEENDWNGGMFTEFETLKDARQAFKKDLGFEDDEARKKLRGAIRVIRCGELTPWFYAVGDQELVGDYVFPSDLQGDPVYTFGKQFVANDERGTFIKTCMGARIRSKEEWEPYAPYHSKKVVTDERVVYWSDGTQTKIDEKEKQNPRELKQGELWITEAIEKFQQVLSGEITEFSIDFTDGTQFTGKIKKKEPGKSARAGRYTVNVTLNNGETKSGYVDFIPTIDCPTIQSYVSSKMKGPVQRISVKDFKADKEGKKWSGVFYNPYFS